MSHNVVLSLFDDASSAANAARELRDFGVPRERVSIVARSHDEQVTLARQSGASPGSELEDSAAASRLGELGGHLLAAIAIVMPGIGPIVTAGPPVIATFFSAWTPSKKPIHWPSGETNSPYGSPSPVSDVALS